MGGQQAAETARARRLEEDAESQSLCGGRDSVLRWACVVLGVTAPRCNTGPTPGRQQLANGMGGWDAAVEVF